VRRASPSSEEETDKRGRKLAAMVRTFSTLGKKEVNEEERGLRPR